MAIFLFTGADLYSHAKKLQLWKREFEKKHGGDMNISIFEGKNTSAREIFQAAGSVPFLAEKRLIIVKDFMARHKASQDEDEKEEAGDEVKAFANLLEKIPDFSVLVMSESAPPDRRTSLYKKIQKLGQIVEFSPPIGSKLLSWIEKTVTSKGGSIERDALLYLSELIPGDLYHLENEISKLIGFTAGARPITKTDIELLTNTQLTTSIFRLTDAIGQKNRKIALETLHQLMESGEELHRILYMIMRQFRIITSVKDLMDQGLGRDAITAKLKEHPFVISNTLAQARNFSLAQLKRAYELLIEIDTKLKSGGIKILVGDSREFVLALDRLVIHLA